MKRYLPYKHNYRAAIKRVYILLLHWDAWNSFYYFYQIRDGSTEPISFLLLSKSYFSIKTEVCDGTICDSLQFVTAARFVTTECFNLWLRHDLWPQNASICDPARFVTKSASICDQRYTMILETKLCRGKLVFMFTLIMNATWYNMMHIYIWTVL